MTTASVTDAARLELSRSEVERLAREVGPAFYLLDLDHVRKSHDELLAAFRDHYSPSVLAYSVKTNYTPRILALVRELGSMAEVVSELEYEIASRVGFGGDEIIVNGPVHQPAFLADMLLRGVRTNLDGWYMLETLHELSRAHPRCRFRVGLRLNYPILGADWSRFGFEVSAANMRRLAEWFDTHENCRVVGLHSHFPLAPPRLDTFRSRLQGLVDTARTWFPAESLEYLDLGSGILPPPEGPPYAELSKTAAAVLENFLVDGRRPTLFIEPGKVLVSGAMAFVCPVVDVKRLGDRILALIDGSNHSINTMMWHERLAVGLLRASDRRAEADDRNVFGVLGNTCMERKDYMCTGVPGPVAKGDYIVFHGVGAYSIGLKPPFIHACPAMVARQGGQYEVVKRRETADDVLRTFSL